MDKTLDIINNSGAFVKGQSQFIKEVLREKVVDMGLPSGLKWATCDIDITHKDKFCKTPFTYNKSFFSWGNIDGHNPKNDSFEEVYDWGNINAAEPWYDNQVYGSTKGHTLTTNIPVSEEFDAARAILGDPWRMPTNEEFEELIKGSIFIDADGVEIASDVANKLITANGVVGIYLQSKVNGNRIFFACSGNGTGKVWYHRGTYGNYWTSTWHSNEDARILMFRSGGVYPNYHNHRYCGEAIRAVRDN